MRFFVHIAYNGQNFRGWQRQLNLYTVQETLENQLSTILKTPITIVGCGRTDAQVHANQYFFHFNVKEIWDFDLLFRLNKTLPHDISVYNIISMDENCHARFDVKLRTYDYFIHTYKDPYLIHRSSYYPIENLQIENMKKACDLISKYDDFKSLCKNPELHKHTICNIKSAKLFTNSNQDIFRFQITADRFLRGMVRLIVGKLIEIGKGKITIAEFEKYLQNKVTTVLHTPAYPQGLYLSKIEYPYLNIPQRTEFFNFMQENIAVK
jgi:tRNA pseudouridine38-40 synthase